MLTAEIASLRSYANEIAQGRELIEEAERFRDVKADAIRAEADAQKVAEKASEVETIANALGTIMIRVDLMEIFSNLNVGWNLKTTLRRLSDAAIDVSGVDRTKYDIAYEALKKAFDRSELHLNYNEQRALIWVLDSEIQIEEMKTLTEKICEYWDVVYLHEARQEAV
ncbi:MAG: hypothetical protein AAGB04_19545 [Pseudomonadota bacterium]